MDRRKLLDTLIEETREATIAYYTYMYADREYIEGEKIHLREAHFLVCVGKCGAPFMSEIANALGISQGAVTQISKRLFKKKLIEKREDEGDRRWKRIILTEEGQRVYQAYCEYNDIRSKAVDACFDDFSEEELNAIIRYETKVKQICRGEIAQDTLIMPK